MALKYINKKGEYVEDGADDSAFQVNTSEKGHEKFIEDIKAQFERSQLPLTSAVTSALEVTPKTENPTTLSGIKRPVLKKLQEAGFDTNDKLAGATDDELKAVEGVTDEVLAEIRKATTAKPSTV